MVAETALPRPPFGSCGLYSTVRVAKLSENWSTGAPELEPPVWYDVTMTFFSSYLRYSCCPSPALRPMRIARGTTMPETALAISSGVALSTGLVKDMGAVQGFPARAPPALLADDWDTPQDHDSITISPLCLSSVDSPSMPSILRK